MAEEAILHDIKKKGLDPRKAYSKLDKDGTLLQEQPPVQPENIEQVMPAVALETVFTPEKEEKMAPEVKVSKKFAGRFKKKESSQ